MAVTYVFMMAIVLTKDLDHKVIFVVAAGLLTVAIGVAIDRFVCPRPPDRSS